MQKKHDLTGQKFGHWTVIEKDPIRSPDGHIYWICECDCKEKTRRSVQGTSLRRGLSLSCGCLQKERTRETSLNNNYGTKNKKDLTNQKRGQLLPLKRLDTKAKNGTYEWLCQCDCGRTCISNTRDLNGYRKIRCEFCSLNATMSIGESLISKILIDNNIKYEYQKQFENCIFPETNKHLKFDFYVPDNNCLIEFDGEQHFKLSATSRWTDKCSTLQERDNYKNLWCFQNNIQLIRIPYTHLHHLTLEDLMPTTSQFLLKSEKE